MPSPFGSRPPCSASRSRAHTPVSRWAVDRRAAVPPLWSEAQAKLPATWMEATMSRRLLCAVAQDQPLVVAGCSQRKDLHVGDPLHAWPERDIRRRDRSLAVQGRRLREGDVSELTSRRLLPTYLRLHFRVDPGHQEHPERASFEEGPHRQLFPECVDAEAQRLTSFAVGRRVENGVGGAEDPVDVIGGHDHHRMPLRGLDTAQHCLRPRRRTTAFTLLAALLAAGLLHHRAPILRTPRSPHLPAPQPEESSPATRVPGPTACSSADRDRDSGGLLACGARLKG